MTPAEAAKILRAHNAWRRATDDDHDQEMPPPKLIGEAIELAVYYIERREAADKDGT